MSRIRFFAIAFAAFAFPSILSYGQQFDNYPVSGRGDDGRIIRSGYITNEWFDNWTISAGAGISTLAASGNEMLLSPAYDLSLMKWATPALAFRFGIQGYQGHEIYTPNFFNHSALPYDSATNTVSWEYYYAHADMVWCASNTLFGYGFRRFYSFSPYVHAGFQRIFDPAAYSVNYDREVALGVGVINTFRLADRLSLLLDLRVSNFSGRFHDNVQGGRVTQLTAAAGLSFNIFKPGWRLAKDIEMARDEALAASSAALARARAAEDAVRSLSEDNAALRNHAEGLEEEINALKAVAAEELKSERNCYDELLHRISDSDLVIYFDKNKSDIRSCEELHIDVYVWTILDSDPDHVFYITGSADEGTGNFEINSRLSRNRVNAVKLYLMRRHGIPANRIVIKDYIISNVHQDGRLDRSVLFENK